MTQVASKIVGLSAGGRSRALDVDHYVSLRIRQRRIMLGLTQQRMAELIGVTYQQAHKYEKGINRIAAGRLSTIAQALGVEIGYLYEGMSETPETVAATPQQRLLLELARSFIAIPDPRRRAALCELARALAETGAAGGGAERADAA